MNSFHALMNAKSAGDGDGRARRGQHDREEGLEARRAVDHRGLLEIDRDGLEGAAELEDRERHRGRRVAEDEAGARVEQVRARRA